MARIKKYEEAKVKYESAVKKLFDGLNTFDDRYQEFLGFAAKMYKMPFNEAVVLFDQNPDIEKAADLNAWNRLGRKVKRGENAIVVADNNSKVKYYFDESQTYGRPLPKLWSVDKETAEQLKAFYGDKYGRSFENFNYVIDRLSYETVDYYDDEINELLDSYSLSDEDKKAFISELITTVRYTVAKRCELDNDGYLMSGTRPFTPSATAPHIVNSPDMFADLLTLTQQYAKETLNDIYISVRTVKKKTTAVNKMEQTVSAAVEGENTTPEQPFVTENSTVIVANGDVKLPTNETTSNFSLIPEDVVQTIVDDVFDDVFAQYHRDGNYGKVDEFLSEFVNLSGYDERQAALINFVLSSNRLTSHSAIDKVEYQYHVKADGVQIVQEGSDTYVSEVTCSWDTVLGLVSDKLKNGYYVPQSVIQERNTAKAQAEEEIIDQPLDEKYISLDEFESIKDKIEFLLNPRFNEQKDILELTNDEIIEGIFKHDEYFAHSCADIADYFAEHEDISDRAEYLKSAYTNEFISLSVNGIECGYKAQADGLFLWTGTFSNRKAQTGIMWEEYAQYVSNMIERGDYVSDRFTSIDEEEYTETKKKTRRKRAKSAPAPDDQLSFFDIGGLTDNAEQAVDTEQIELQAESSEKTKRIQSVKSFISPKFKQSSTNWVSQYVIDHVLRDGSMERDSVRRIVFHFSVTEDISEKADFLRKEMLGRNGESGEGRGYVIPNPDIARGYNQYTSWYNEDGLIVANADNIHNTNAFVTLSWEQMAERITEMLDNGTYCPQEIIDIAADRYAKDVADRLWYLHQDTDNEVYQYFIPKELFKGGFPDSTEHIKDALTNSDTLQEYINGLTQFIADYEQNRDILRFHFHRPAEILADLKLLTNERKQFKATEVPDKPKNFVSENQKEYLLFNRGHYANGKFSISEYFTEHDDKKDREKFLKNFYGTGGGSTRGGSEWHDSKGFVYAYGYEVYQFPDAKVVMKWSEVTSIIDRLIREERYITQNEIDNAVSEAKREVQRYEPDTDDYYKTSQYENALKFLATWEPLATVQNEPEKSERAKVSDLAVGDVIMYDGSRREVTEISSERIKLKDLDAPDHGGVLISTSDILAYDGWQEDMENKGFEILSKAADESEQAVTEVTENEQETELTEEISKEIKRLSRQYPALFGGDTSAQKIPNTTEHRNFVNMQKLFPDIMAHKHRYERYVSGEDSGYEPLTVEWITDNRLSLSHTYTQLGDLMYDPMIDYEIDFEKQTANAVMYEQSALGIYQEYSNGTKGQRDTNTFTKTWLKNIREQSSERHLQRVIAEHEYNDDRYDITINYDENGNVTSIDGYEDAVADYTAKNDVAVTIVDVVPEEVTQSGAVGEYEGETVVVSEINEEENTAEITLLDYSANVKQEVSAEELEEGFNEYVEPTPNSTVSRAFSSFRNNHELSDEQLKFLDRAEKQIYKAGYDRVDLHGLFEIQLFRDTYGSFERANETLFDGKLNEYTEELNGTIDDTINVEPVVVPPTDYVFDEKNLVNGGAKVKYAANVNAIKTLLTVEKENRNATPEEQAIMAGYSGWGGIPQAFDPNNALWKSEYAELKELLSDTQYAAARASTISSFYSPPEVIDGIYQALDQFHFIEGNVLEPSMGVGNFFAKLPEDLRGYTKLYGIEIDDISGRIAKKLYPSANIQIKGFEESKYNDNSFDVIIGNVPFGDIKLHDKRYDKYNLPMHDYFAAKSIDQVKPGGIVAFVTSKYTMDKNNPTARKYLAERADLLGAVRLPAGTFKDTDNTTTDILFFKKKDKIDVVNTPDWVHVDENSEGIAYNRYFHEHPDMILGTMAWDERMRGRYGEDANVTVCLPDESDTRPLSEKISEAVSKIEGRISVNRYEQERIAANTLPADPNVKNYTFTIVDGELYFRENEVMLKSDLQGKSLERVIGMHKVRQAAINLINAESNGCSDNQMTVLQRVLNNVYDDFVKHHGYLNDSANVRLFKDDDDCNTLLALENKDDNEQYIKAAIFFKRTINPSIVVTSVDTPEESLQVSLDRLGRVDIKYMSQITGVSPEEIISTLGDSIYRNPANVVDDEPYSGYEDASEYLSGNVVVKLDHATAMAADDPSYERNVKALESVLPDRVTAEDIAVRLGTAWITDDDYNQFYTDYTGLSTDWRRVMRTPIGEYKFTEKIRNVSGNVANEVYGTDRMNSYQIFENLLNQRQIVVKDAIEEEEGKIKYVVNDKATRFAREKARQMEQAFKDWIWSDVERRERYEDLYNRNFNCLVGRNYDGSKQQFDGMNPNYSLYPHQKDAVMRAKLSGNTLLAHEVGAGKTFEMITIVEEKKRLGLINKACVTVPKALTEQMGAEWKRLYPNSNILVAKASDFTKNNRQRFFARCATGDYDAIIMSHEQFGKIGMSKDYQEHFINEQLSELENAINGVSRYGRTSEETVSVKAMERQKKNLEEKLKKLLDSPKDTSLSFEQLGFDYLVVDEAHNFKNCFVFTKMGNIAGVQTTASQKAADMLMKCDYLNNKFDCHNILFATGTPLSNSMTELYVMNRYLRPDLLRDSNTINFDDWAANFGETVTKLEPKPDGNGYRSKKRFSKFVNLPELISFYKEYADIKTIDMIGLKVPKMIGGEAQIIVSEPDDYQKKGVQELAERSELIHNGSVEPWQDNMLKITGEARLLGLDARTKYEDAPDTESNKISAVVSNVMKHYKETESEKGVQAIFCDIAVNADDGKFSAYNAIKEKLIEKGIPENEICFAGDAKNETQRNIQHEELRQGIKRIVIGSTGKMGTGVNIQDRLCAMHHLDIAWKPSDFEQRNGRGIRQGNQFSEVGVYHYVTQDTFDLYMMETVVRKAKFIGQLKNGNCTQRTCEDIDDMTLTYSRIQAATTSNPLIVERFELNEELQELRLLRNHHQRNKFKLQKDIERVIPEKIERYELLNSKVQADLRQYENNKTEELTLYVDNKPITESKEICAEIDKARKLCSMTSDAVKVGVVCGFDVYVDKKPAETLFYNQSPYEIVVQGNLKYTNDIGIDNGLGNATRLNNVLTSILPQRAESIPDTLQGYKLELEKTKEEYAKPFEREEEYQRKESRFEELNELLANDEAANAYNNAGEEDDEQFGLDDDDVVENKQENSRVADSAPKTSNVIVDDETLDLRDRSGSRH